MHRKKLLLNVAAAAVVAAVPATAAAHGGHGGHGEDGTHSLEVVGTVTSFADGKLTVTLGDGSTLVGKVTDRTDIECKGDNGLRARGDGKLRARAAHNGGDDGHGRRGLNRHHCGTAALTAGAKVHEAELAGTSTGAVFKDVELVS
jgi:hypothetical protein